MNSRQKRPAGPQALITAACQQFTRDLLAIFGQMTVEQVNALAAPRDGRSLVSAERKARLAKIGAMRLPCPVSSCNEPGVRSKRNFCLAHAAKLSGKEKDRLRAQQKAKRALLAAKALARNPERAT